MNPDLSKALAELANKLGTSIEHLWPSLVGHAKTDALIGIYLNIGFTVIALLLFGLAAWCLYRLNSGPASDDIDPLMWGLILGTLGGVGLLVASLVCISINIPDYKYPEAKAIRQLLGR